MNPSPQLDIRISGVYLRILTPLTFRTFKNSADGNGDGARIISRHGLVSRVQKLLCSDKVAGLDWNARQPHAEYLDDLLPVAREYLFGEERTTACTYFRLDANANSWFSERRVSLEGPDGAIQNWPSTISLASDSGIEFILSPSGVGLLSVSLQLDGSTALADVRELQHRMANVGSGRRVWFRKATPVAPAAEASIDERLKKGAFEWEELWRRLLKPLEDECDVPELATSKGQPRPRRLTTCTTLDITLPTPKSPWDLQHPATRAATECAVSSLAQIHPQVHPGELTDAIPVRLLHVNRSHIAAVGLAGAAHAVIRQDHPYDPKHVRRVHNTYFSCHLLALLHRLTLQRFLQEVSPQLERHAAQRRKVDEATRTIDDLEQQIKRARPWTSERRQLRIKLRSELETLKQSNDSLSVTLKQISALRYAFLSSNLASEFIQVSTRATTQLYHEAAQEALRVPDALRTARRALNDWDGIHQLDKQSEATRQMSESLESVKAVQGKLEWVEVMIVSVYVVELAHIVATGFHFTHGVVLGTWFIALGLVSLAIAFFALRPYHIRRSNLLTIILFVALAILFGAFVYHNGAVAKTRTAIEQEEMDEGADADH